MTKKQVYYVCHACIPDADIGSLTKLCSIHAAAPVLLEALQAWVEASGWDKLPDPDDFVLTPDQRHVWQLTRKAIAQAEGKEA